MQEQANNQNPGLVETLHEFNIVVKNISDSLTILIDKRATLEEKMIKSYFVKLASIHDLIGEQMRKALALPSARISNVVLTDLSAVANKTRFRTDQFLKAARYDLNYLEQYFEYQFYSELERSNLLEDSLKLLASLSAEVASLTKAASSQAETE